MPSPRRQKKPSTTKAKDRRIACLESRAAKWHDLLSDVINECLGRVLVGVGETDAESVGLSIKSVTLFFLKERL